MKRENAQAVLPQSVSTKAVDVIVHRGYAKALDLESTS